MRIALLTVLTVAASAAAASFAQSYPTKPVRVIEPFGLGSGVDVMARIVAEKLSERWGQPVTVENHIGRGGTVAPGLVAKSPADGYTLLANSSAHVYSPSLVPNLDYDALKDFVAVAPLASQPYVLVVGKPAGIKTVGELIVAAKAKPGTLNFGSAGKGTGTHLGAEKLNLAAGMKAVHVPLTPAQATTETIAGRITYWLSPVSLALPHIRDGTLLVLGVSSARRSSILPTVSTIAEAGVPDFDHEIWYGIWAPAASPAAVIDKMSKDIALALAAPDVRERLGRDGAEPMSMTLPEFARFVRVESEVGARIVKAAGITP